ncbi:E3 ubiquitin-protein ligase TRIM45-like isoform X2 [Mytilus edulis]|uniref:E3 ubiquitin-protein ligase TRIM45-like isoform X2 n=1 Tax=Mytilus edulis TaxID=6550 RepID=UPI0039F11DE2
MAQIMAQTCEFSCKEEATLYCKVCKQFLCIDCKQTIHDKFPKYKDHAVMNIHQEGNCVFRPHPVCETHKDTFVFYCCKCECLTCAECMTSTHNEHKTEKIKNVADARRHNVNQIVQQLKTKVDIVKKKLETIDTEQSIQIQADCLSYVKKVEETVDDLHMIVDRHKLIPLTTASDFKDIENEDLGRKRVFFRRRHDETAIRLLKFENLLKETHDSTFLTEWKALQTDVQMNNEETDDPLVAPRRIESFNQKKLTKFVIDEIDEKFQMKLKEQEKEVVRLTEGIGVLTGELKEKQEQLDDLSNHV